MTTGMRRRDTRGHNPTNHGELYSKATTEASPEINRRDVSCIWLPRQKLTDSIQCNIRHEQSCDRKQRCRNAAAVIIETEVQL